MTNQEFAATGNRLREEDIPWGAIEREVVVNEEELFYLIVTASFVKTASNLDAVKLVDYFSNDDEVSGWLNMRWQYEEIQHGQILKRYVQSVWPQFDWNSAYQFFFLEYAPSRLSAPLEPMRSLEIASRYALEMCAVGYYEALSHLSQDPILSMLALRVSEDGLRHCQNFYRYFARYREDENIQRVRVLRTLLNCLRIYYGNASLLALKHVYGACHPSEPFNVGIYQSMQKRCRYSFMRYFQNEMNTRRLLKPLELGAVTRRMTLPIVRVMARRMMA
ncbi:MAG: hypothetical protein ACYDB9_01695 [Gammaproteobacteria bacterium]